jgi:long-chain fatty acid transport protein
VSPRIPDADRVWISTGFNYAFSRDASVDVGYAHLFIDDTRIDSVQQGNQLAGQFKASVDIFGVQGNWRF